MQAQGISYIVGNTAADGKILFRGTVTMAVPRHFLSANPPLGSIAVGDNEPRIPFDVNGAVRQFRLIQKLVEQFVSSSEPIKIDSALIRQLHAAAGDPGNPDFGNFRSVDVVVGTYRAPPPNEIAALVDTFCADLNSLWETENPLRLSAFALWRFNWIHPFVDANGRTGRALSYLILNLKFGMLLPGVPTLPEQLSDRRRQYFDALAVADATYSKTGIAEIEPLATLLEELLIRQLRNLPAQSDRDEAAIADIFRRRIASADPATLRRIYGDSLVSYRTWAHGDVLIVHVAPTQAIENAEALFEKEGQPFPGLISEHGDAAVLSLGTEHRGAIVRPRAFKVDAAAIHLDPNAAVVVESPKISFALKEGAEDWEVDGALYVLRYGNEISSLGLIEVLDWLVRRHIQES